MIYVLIKTVEATKIAQNTTLLVDGIRTVEGMGINGSLHDLRKADCFGI